MSSSYWNKIKFVYFYTIINAFNESLITKNMIITMFLKIFTNYNGRFNYIVLINSISNRRGSADVMGHIPDEKKILGPF